MIDFEIPVEAGASSFTTGSQLVVSGASGL